MGFLFGGPVVAEGTEQIDKQEYRLGCQSRCESGTRLSTRILHHWKTISSLTCAGCHRGHIIIKSSYYRILQGFVLIFGFGRRRSCFHWCLFVRLFPCYETGQFSSKSWSGCNSGQWMKPHITADAFSFVVCFSDCSSFRLHLCWSSKTMQKKWNYSLLLNNWLFYLLFYYICVDAQKIVLGAL